MSDDWQYATITALLYALYKSRALNCVNIGLADLKINDGSSASKSK